MTKKTLTTEELQEALKDQESKTGFVGVEEIGEALIAPEILKEPATMAPEDFLHMIEALIEDYSLKFGTDPIKLASEESQFLSLIYRLAHVAAKPSCLHVHGGWVKEAQDLFNEMKTGGLI